MPHVTLLDAMKVAFGKMNAAVASGRTEQLPFGIDRLDRCAYVLPGCLSLIVGRPGVGKSSLMLNLVRASLGRGEGVALLTPGQGVDHLVWSLVAAEAGVNSSKMSSLYLSEPDWKAITDTAGRLRSHACLLDGSRQTSSGIEASIRSMVEQLRQSGPATLVAVDYCQMIEGDGRPRSRYEELGEVSRRLRALAAELGVAIVAVSQLNRNASRRGAVDPDAVPELYDLRDAGSLEDDADLILALNEHREDPDVRWCTVLKQRRGPKPTIPLLLHADLARFEAVDEARAATL